MKRKPVTVRRSKTDARRIRVIGAYDVCHDGVVMAKMQEDYATGNWFWYGMGLVGGNTAGNLRPFDIVKAEAVAACKHALEDRP